MGSNEKPDHYNNWIEYFDGTFKEVTHDMIQEVIKDLLFVRHRMAAYKCLSSEYISFGHGHLGEKYWEYLRLRGQITPHRKDELEEGVLLIIFIIYSEFFEGKTWSSLHDEKFSETIKKFVLDFEPDNDKKKKLKSCLQFFIEHFKNERVRYYDLRDLNEQEKKLQGQLMENHDWVYDTFIEGFFVEIANSLLRNAFKPQIKYDS